MSCRSQLKYVAQTVDMCFWRLTYHKVVTSSKKTLSLAATVSAPSCRDGEMREREDFIRHKYRSTLYMNSTTIREMWQVARKGARLITLATLKKKTRT